MDADTVLVMLALLFGFYMAWNIGANDVANAMGASVGSGALTIVWAVILAGIFEFAGAYFVGSHVAETVRKGIFDPMLFVDKPRVLAVGMLASLLAAGVWLQTASYFGWPVSTTHSIVGAVVGFGVVAAGPQNVDWGEVGRIATSWVISPLLSAAIAYLLFRMVLRHVFYQPDPVRAARRLTPWAVFAVLAILTLVTGFKALSPFWKERGLDAMDRLPVLISCGAAVVVGLIGAFVSARLVRHLASTKAAPTPRVQQVYVATSLEKAKKHLDRAYAGSAGPLHERVSNVLDEVGALSSEAKSEFEYQTDSVELKRVERIFAYLVVLTACFVAFAHGANDVANAIGPLSAAVQAVQKGVVATKAAIPPQYLLLGAVGIVIGLATWGRRVMETVGRRITELTPSRGFCVQFGAASTILVASLLKLPISTTHTVVGAVLGVGLARGMGALNLNTIRDIVVSWLVTIPAGVGLSIVFYYGLGLFF